jgi:putative ubiquitin-RnfH superfamily antitoxin RatB of RatAB toxin-antitoxin module
MAPAEWLNVEVVYCPVPGQLDVRRVQLPAGAVLSDALVASGILDDHAEPAEGWRLGIWGRVQEAKMPLRDHDRVELYRGLQVDPKEARRLRYKRHKPARANKTPSPPSAA